MRLLLIFETTVELTYSGHVFWRKLLGFSGVIGNVVIEIMAPRLNRRHVQIICNDNCNKLRQSVNAFLNLFLPLKKLFRPLKLFSLNKLCDKTKQLKSSTKFQNDQNKSCSNSMKK